MTPKIALFDIETAPNLGWVWAKWEQDVIEFEKHWYILSFAYKWLDGERIYTRALPDYSGYKPNSEDDKRLCKDLWELFNKADILIGHNSDSFDVRKANARFVAHGFDPPDPYTSIDTLKIARKHFRFDSNRLDDLGAYLGAGRKLATTGKKLWLDCAVKGKQSAWIKMKEYNGQDVALLERVYLKLRPWATSHPRITDFTREDGCPTCGSHHVRLRGFRYSRTGKKQRISCEDCGAKWTIGKLIRDDRSW